MKPKLLDLFCGGGGATKGYQRAGFEVWGVDVEPQRRYCGDHFLEADVLELEPWFLAAFDAIHASPPCQWYSMHRNNGSGRNSPAIIPETRELLEATGLPYVIENVEQARFELREPALICGGSLGLRIKALDADLPRHRLFETNWPLMVPPCSHRVGRTVSITGNGIGVWGRARWGRNLTAAEKAEAMEIDWLRRGALEQAIPPAMAELVGWQLRAFV